MWAAVPNETREHILYELRTFLVELEDYKTDDAERLVANFEDWMEACDEDDDEDDDDADERARFSVRKQKVRSEFGEPLRCKECLYDTLRWCSTCKTMTCSSCRYRCDC